MGIHFNLGKIVHSIAHHQSKTSSPIPNEKIMEVLEHAKKAIQENPAHLHDLLGHILSKGD